jgi:mRNA-degrading endonuclease toxin of MazEF toxin-antitoxin module
VYSINLEPASPPELGRVRPGIVVSNTIQNERLDSVVVVPLSSRAPEIWPLRVKLSARGLRPSYAVIPGIRQVSKGRLHELVAPVAPDELDRLTTAVNAYLSD